MLFYAAASCAKSANGHPTLLVLTDRKRPLDDQLFGQSSAAPTSSAKRRCGANREQLRELLNRASAAWFHHQPEVMPEKVRRCPELSARRNIV